MKNLFILNDKFILPIVINILYILAVIFSILFGIHFIYDEVIDGYGWNTELFLIAGLGLFFIFAMPFIIRVYAEVLVVLFKIYKKMQLISELKAKKLQRENAGE